MEVCPTSSIPNLGPSIYAHCAIQVVFVGKLVGAILFEPVIERVGCKVTLYIGSAIQILGIVRTCIPSPSLPLSRPPTGPSHAFDRHRKATGKQD